MNEAQRPAILVVDDTPANLVAMRRLLTRVDADVVTVESGNEALGACLEREFALVLLDVQMPGMDGFEVATLLGEESSTKDVPIIFVTAAYADDLNRLKGYRSGAVDYIAKPVNDVILTSKVEVFLDLYRSKAQMKLLLSRLNERNEQLEKEITERRKAEETVRHQALHDSLTGLPNRAHFMDRLQRAVGSGWPFALIYVDIDGFKPVNDRYGHPAGDALLKAIAGRLLGGVRPGDCAARLGGDEFALVIEGLGKIEAAVILAEKVLASLRQPYSIPVGGETVTVNAGGSLGLAMFPTHGTGDEALLLAADSAMYAAKRGGKNRVVVAGASASASPEPQNGTTEASRV